MNISEYLNSAWSLHAKSPEKVLSEVREQLSNVQNEEEIIKLAHLIVHVSGEHLGKWQEGLELLRKLKHNALLKNKADLLRYMAILELGNNPNTSIEKFSNSDQARIFASTASALISIGGVKAGEKFIKKAADLATDLENTDTAQTTIAINANNIASTLESKIPRTETETSLMIFAAKTARVFWEKAGTWKEVERAEYRLAHSYLKAEQYDLALEHADLCMKIVNENQNEPLELFFAFEAKATALKAINDQEGFKTTLSNMNKTFMELSADDKSWCEGVLKKLN